MSKHETETIRKPLIKRALDKLYGGIDFTWPKLILYSIGAAILTSIFLILPIFKNTSFVRMGETYEAWVFLAIIIIANSKKPLESALKTFVFFLISQPLIYLFQVPFNWQGWGIFGYYRFWFILTLCTFPAAYIGWYIKKKNWLSLLILAPILALLAISQDFRNPPIASIFCLGQILIYLFVFTKNLAQKIVGLLIPIITIAIILLAPENTEFSTNQPLPDGLELTENAVITVDDTEIANIRVFETGKDTSIVIDAHKNGRTTFKITDGDKEYTYILIVSKDDQGAHHARITPLDSMDPALNE